MNEAKETVTSAHSPVETPKLVEYCTRSASCRARPTSAGTLLRTWKLRRVTAERSREKLRATQHQPPLTRPAVNRAAWRPSGPDKGSKSIREPCPSAKMPAN